MTLWLVRHAQPQIQEGLCYGQLDMPADPLATQHAAQAIAPLLPLGAKLHCSGLQRAQQLAQAIQQQLARTIHDQRDALLPNIDVRLNEMNFGVWEGVAWNEIPKAAFDRWTQDFDQHRFGGVEGVRDLLLRVHQALHELPTKDDAVWITHAGVIRAVNYLVRDGIHSVATPETWPTEAPAFGKWQCLELGQHEAC
jgi:alpha-ribazole phosphatase